MNEKSEEGDDGFSMTNFDFMLVGTKLVGEKIRDTPTGKLQQED